jgi:hypothetical protein
MKIFLDTASLKEIREAATLGVVDGITTNPSLLAKESGDPEQILVEICNTIDGPISGEVVATDAEGKAPERLAELAPAKAAYLDESAVQGVVYRYTLTAFDRSGNEGPPTDPVEATLP